MMLWATLLNIGHIGFAPVPKSNMANYCCGICNIDDKKPCFNRWSLISLQVSCIAIHLASRISVGDTGISRPYDIKYLFSDIKPDLIYFNIQSKNLLAVITPDPGLMDIVTMSFAIVTLFALIAFANLS